MVIFERLPDASYLYKAERKDLKWWTAHRWNVWRLREASGQSTFALVYWCQLDSMGAFVHVRRENARRPVRPQTVAAAARLVLRKLLSDHPMLLCTVPEDNPRMARLLSRLGFRALALYDDGVEPGRVFLLMARWRDGASLLPVEGSFLPA
ncbi:MAG: hypothetical protein II943_00465 [Victivallales bacterium]|nr:hypothetical protein [Victivallales bacterium]